MTIRDGFKQVSTQSDTVQQPLLTDSVRNNHTVSPSGCPMRLMSARYTSPNSSSEKVQRFSSQKIEFPTVWPTFPQMTSHKTFRTKRILAKKIKQNRPMPQFYRHMTGIRHIANPMRRHWRRRKLNI